MGGISSEIDSITQQIEELNSEISSLGSSSGSFGYENNTVVSDKNQNTQPSNEDHIHSIIKEMYSNMNEHGGSGSSTSNDRKAQLSARNLFLGETELHRYGIMAHRSRDPEDYGTWYTDSTKKKKLFDAYRKYIYHTGGYVGGTPLKPNERYIKVENGELIMTSSQQNSLAEQIDRIKTMADAFKGNTLLSPVAFKNGALSGIERNSISNITNNSRPVEINIGDTIIQGNANRETVEAHRKVTEAMVNEFARLTGVKW